MTRLETYLAEVSIRAEAATPGPWEYKMRFDVPFVQMLGTSAGFMSFAHLLHPEVKPKAFMTCEFIAHSRTDIPRLVEMVREAREHLLHVAKHTDDFGTGKVITRLDDLAKGEK